MGELPTFGELRQALDELPVAVRVVQRLRGLTTVQVAQQLEISRSTLYRFEQGGGCDVHTLRKVLTWLGTDTRSDVPHGGTSAIDERPEDAALHPMCAMYGCSRRE